MPIQINTTRGQLKFNTTNAKLNIKQPKGELRIQQPQAELTLDRELPKVKIDQYQCFAEAGLKNNSDFSKELTQLAKRKAIEGIGRIVSEGNRMSDIRRGSPNTIAQVAKEKSMPKRREFVYDGIPKSRPKISVEGHLNVNWKTNKPIIEYTPRKPIIEVQRGKIEGYLDPYPDIKIRYIDERN